MATRKSEWWALVKPILDREEIKNDAKTLAKELSDILEFKVTDADSLEQLTKEFNKQLVNMGKQQIVFSEKTLQGIVSQFANAIAEGITKGVNDIGHINADSIGKKIGDRIGEGIAGGIIDGVSDGLKDASNNLEAEFDQLIQKQAQKMQELDKLRSKVARKEAVEKKLEFDWNSTEKADISNIDDLKKKIKEVWLAFDNINADFLDAKDSGNVTEKLLKQWQNAAKEMLKIRNVIADLNSQTIEIKEPQGGIFASTKPVTKAEHFLDKRTREYFLDTIEEEESFAADLATGQKVFDEYVDTDKFEDKIKEVKSELSELEYQIHNIEQKHPELISRKNEIETLDRIEKIQTAYEKLAKTKTGQKTFDKIENALEYKGAGADVPAMPEQPTLGYYDDGYGDAQRKYKDSLKAHAESYERAKSAIEKAFQAYYNSVGKSWDERYRLLIKAAEEFASIENSPNISNKDKEDVLGGYRETFEQEIQPIKDIARDMLQDIINLRDGKDLVSTRIPSKEDNAAPDVEDVSNAQKLTEETEDNADAGKRAREEAEKKRLADEASASANNDAADAAERERLAKEASASADSAVETKEPKGAVGSDVDTKYGNDARKNIQTILKDADKFLASNKDKKIKDYFELIATDAYKMSDDVKTAIEETIGSIDSLQSINIGANNQGGLIGDKSALILRKPHFDRDKQKWSTDEPNDNAISLQSRLNNANIHDVNLGKIQEVIKAEEYLVELQNRVSGTPISTIGEAIEDINPDVLNATETSIQSLIQAMRELYNIGVEVDVENLGNILYDGKRDRFGIVDMDVKHDFESFEDMLSAFAQAVRNQVEDISDILNNPNMAQSWSRFADMIDSEVEKAKLQLSTPDVIEGRTDNQSDEQYKRVKQETSAHQENTDAIKNETKVQEELNNVKSQTANIDDDSETIAKENGALEDKLELLRDIADQYAANITQKQRDRYEELNQKDMDTGLSDKEDERYYELGEQIDSADSALEEFGQTYDKIILKLENGKKVEILPDDKGLRSLYKFADEYGETYGGVEIEDVIFERVKQEANARQQNAEAIKSETKAQEELNKANGQAQGTGDASSADVAAANAEAEKQRIEKERIEAEKIALQQEITNKNEELERVRDELADEAYKHSEARSVLIAHIDEVEEERDKAYQSQVNAELEITEKDKVIKDLREQLAQVQSGDGPAKASIDLEELKNKLSAITYNVKVVQDTDSADSKVAIDEAELKNVLNSITYNVKIANDDSDNTANKITLDESALESTLKRAFVNILGPNVEQDNAEPNNTPWALESTLNGVIKETLAQIQTNTAKPESLEVAPAKTDVGNVLATENTLAAIKTAVESINSKISGKISGVVKREPEQPAQTQNKKNEHKDGTISHGQAEGAPGSMQKLFDYYYWIEEQIEQFKNNEAYVAELQKVQARIVPKLVEYYKKLEKTGEEEPAWMAPLNEKHDLHMSKIRGGEAQSDSVSTEKKALSILKEEYKLKKEIFVLEQKGATRDDVAPLQEKLGIYRSIREALEINMTDDELLRYATAATKEVDKGEHQLTVKQITANIQARKAELKSIEKETKANNAKLEKEIKDIAKEEDKDAKKKAANDKKMAQKQAMVGKAGNAIGRAENVWLGAQDTDEPLPPELNERIDELYNKLVTLREKQNEVNQAPMASPEQQKELRNQTVEVNSLTNEVGELLSEYQRLSGKNAEVIGKNALGHDASLGAYEQQLKQAVKAKYANAQIKSFDAATKTLTYTVKTGAHEFTEYTATVRRAGDALVSVRGTTKRTETFFEATARKLKELTSYFSGMAIFSRIGQELRRGIQYVREIDLALTELKKVTDETEETYDKFLQTAAKTGARLGTTISAVTEATATFAKLGYSMEQATEMAEAALACKNVGDNIATAEDAADSIISTMKGFRLEASESMAIVDRFNEVGNRFAITSQGIGEALRLSASALSEGGNSLDESIGLITAANEVVNDPSSVGTALKTLTLRLRGSKTELEDMGEDVTDMATTTSQLQAKLLALTGGQVDIMLDANTFKSSTQILREMSDAWEDMNDIQRASALELMGGKRQANVLSAIIQNFDTVEKAIETSANSAGSALKENERYLNSIQGRVDQFNNAVQAMWSNALDSDVVKGFVAFGTEIIKIIDKIGLLKTAFGALATYSMMKHKMGPITFFKELVGLIPKGVKALQTWIQGMQASDAATVASIKTKVADTAATTANTAANTANAASSVAGGVAEGKDTADTIENTVATVADTAATTANTAANTANAASSVAGGVAEGATAGTSGVGAAAASFTGLAAAVPYILGAVAAIAAIVVVFKLVTKDINELKEELQESQSELNNTKSEIESINSELETTQKRIAELLAKPSLSFVEQEELEKLQQQNALLERNLKLQEMILAQKEAEVVADTQAYLSAAWDGSKWYDKPYAVDSATGIISEDKWYTRGVSAKDALDVAIDKYAETKQISDALAALALEWDDYSSDGNAKLISDLGLDNMIYAGVDDKSYVLEQQKAYDAALVQIASGISSVLDNPQYYGLSYGMSSEINAFLDEWNAYQYKFQEAQGLGGKSSAIASIFDDTSSDSIKKLKEDLTEIAGDDTLDAAKKQEKALGLVNKAINSTSGEYDRLNTSMDIIGITADEVARYFVQLSKAPDSSTIEGITTQYQKGVDALGKYKGAVTDIIAEFTDLDGTVEQITWGSLFDNEGKAVDAQISKVLQGANETTRAEFARIVKSVNEGTMSIEQAMSSFSGSGLVSISKLIEESFGALNKSVFKGIEDEISGFIDTFSEFSAALEDVASSMDLLHTAQEQYNNSGQVSVKTALELMQSTDQWNKILTVENGKIMLNAEAQDILVQSKLNTVQANLAEAKASIQNQLAQLGAADATLLSAEASDITTEAYTIYTNAMNSYTASIAGFGAALDALVNGRIFGDDGIIGSFKSAYDATKHVTTYENNTSIVALREQLAEVNQMEDFFEGVDTFDEFVNNYDFDENPGDKYGNDEDSKTEEKMDAFQKAMDYWENRIGAKQAKYEQIQNEIDLLEANGQKSGAQYYKKQIKLEKQRLSLLERQKAEAQRFLGTFAEGSEEWWDVANTLNDIESELDDVTASIVDLKDAMADTHWYMFDEAHDRVSTLTSDLENIRDILSNEELFDDEGDFTKEGLGTLASYVQELGVYEGALADARKEMELFGDAYDPSKTYVDAYGNNLSIDSEQDWYEAAEKAEEKYDEWNQKVIETRYSIKDLYEQQIDAVEEYTSTLVENYRDYIDVVKEALDSERDLYEFKKSTEQKSKNIASIERRIASLSGSTKAADAAERRKLQAELTDAKSDMEDHYYSHAKEQQAQALDDEATAYEAAMNAFIENLYTKLEESTAGLYMSYEEMSTETKSFVDGVTESVVLNAGNVKDTYLATGETINDCLMTPWINAAVAIGAFDSSDGALGLMNSWTESKAGAPFYDFQTKVSGYLSKPWSDIIAESGPVNTFKTSVNSIMSQIVSDVQSNVSGISGVVSGLQTEIDKIKDTTIRVTTVYETQGKPDSSGSGSGTVPRVQKRYYTTATLKIGSQTITATGSDPQKKYAEWKAKTAITGEYEKLQKSKGISEQQYKNSWQRRYRDAVKYETKYYAKGITGTDKNQFAIVDELGEELVLHANPTTGRLEYLTKGSGVVPSDLTSELMELGKIGVDGLMDMNKFGANVNMISNAVTKPNYEFNFDSMVHVDHCDQGTLKDLEKMVDNKIDDFSRALNYSIKKFAR